MGHDCSIARVGAGPRESVAVDHDCAKLANLVARRLLDFADFAEYGFPDASVEEGFVTHIVTSAATHIPGSRKRISGYGWRDA